LQIHRTDLPWDIHFKHEVLRCDALKVPKPKPFPFVYSCDKEPKLSLTVSESLYMTIKPRNKINNAMLTEQYFS